ncbi:hypothetical protein F9L33_11585 [Amylibacter sp. SFDW26]|uniref:hypothetical protein n=1 Tax=Amylibacter sp. SFDW26 TaxID=2652722 RepID=UPI0012627009|nr:hypothetical protein [Amylibacter sp. SFDW26]KAB7613242.1 hypothetical protein F9L33_11585 [Amylibacter sp. SFDW26]
MREKWKSIPPVGHSSWNDIEAWMSAHYPDVFEEYFPERNRGDKYFWYKEVTKRLVIGLIGFIIAAIFYWYNTVKNPSGLFNVVIFPDSSIGMSINTFMFFLLATCISVSLIVCCFFLYRTIVCKRSFGKANSIGAQINELKVKSQTQPSVVVGDQSTLNMNWGNESIVGANTVSNTNTYNIGEFNAEIKRLVQYCSSNEEQEAVKIVHFLQQAIEKGENKSVIFKIWNQLFKVISDVNQLAKLENYIGQYFNGH